MDTLFDHEKLEVYQLSRTRNIAEGAGKWKLPDKIHFYHIARGSATECAACLDELVDTASVPAARVRPLKLVLSRIVAMLVAMIRSLEGRRAKDMQQTEPRP